MTGSLGQAHTDILTVMRTSLALTIRLNRLALERDPADSLPIPTVCRRVYGLYGCGSMWRLLLMVAEESSFVSIY